MWNLSNNLHLFLHATPLEKLTYPVKIDGWNMKFPEKFPFKNRSLGFLGDIRNRFRLPPPRPRRAASIAWWIHNGFHPRTNQGATSRIPQIQPVEGKMDHGDLWGLSPFFCWCLLQTGGVLVFLLFGWCWVIDDVDLFHEGELQQKVCVAKCNRTLRGHFRCFLSCLRTKNPSQSVDDRCTTEHFSLSRIASGVVHSVQYTPSKKHAVRPHRKPVFQPLCFQVFFVATFGECGWQDMQPVPLRWSIQYVCNTTPLRLRFAVQAVMFHGFNKSSSSQQCEHNQIHHWVNQLEKSDFTNLYPKKNGENPR